MWHLVISSLLLTATLVTAMPTLEEAWKNPPQEAKLRAYWWWLNGNVTKEAITSDLEAMKEKGFGGAVIFDADGAAQFGNSPVPAGPTFGSPAWRELFKHTLHEADRLGLTLSLNIQSGWNLGGPSVTPEDAAKLTVWSETRVSGPADFHEKLPLPNERFYRDAFVLAWKNVSQASEAPQITARGSQAKHLPAALIAPGKQSLQPAADRALLSTLPGSAPDLTRLLTDIPNQPGDHPIPAAEILDLTSKMATDGTLTWKAPPGEWTVLRFGYTIGPRAHVSTASGDWKGYALDVFDKHAFRTYWDEVVAPLIQDAGPLAGKSLKYLHTDSWEIEPVNWTSSLPAEFAKRRGYAIHRWLPVIAGHIVESREASTRFLNDFRKTLGELAIDNHYKPFKELAHAAGLEIHPESGGPHVVPIDAQQCLGFNDVPMSEFWATSWKHRVGDANCFFVKQPASAAHTNGRPLVMAEGFTTVGPHWQERLGNTLKPNFDKALTEGLNSLVWHAFVCSPKETGIPGQQYFAGTHLNPKVTWWSRSKPFFDYINRSQTMMQRGLPVSDVLYYYGDHVPNYTQLRDADPAGVGPGYDYDVITAGALMERISVKDGRLVLPEGTSYRMLMLPALDSMSIEVLRKLESLSKAGATIAGPRPTSPSGLLGFTDHREEFDEITERLWGQSPGILPAKTSLEVLESLKIPPDFTFAGGDEKSEIRYVHRRDGEAEIYFIASRGERPENLTATFRVAGKAPELWNPVTGKHTVAPEFSAQDDLTHVPLQLDPNGSVFVVFRSPGKPTGMVAEPQPSSEINGPWELSFDPAWGGPEDIIFENLTDWAENEDPGIRHYSGTATYRKSFTLSQTTARTWLDLGDVRELAEVHLNGKSLGILWSKPFRVEITTALKPGENHLEIDVVNFWPNRVIGDAGRPAAERLTRTNVLELKSNTPLMTSGLLGPVRILTAAD